jgi:hypothetical protein
VGPLRQRIANLVVRLRHLELATLLRPLTQERLPRIVQQASARAVLDAARVREVDGSSAIGGLVGGIVTRAGPLTHSALAAADQDVLARLNLRSVFVAAERNVIRAAIDGEAETVRRRLTDVSRAGDVARSDRAGGWIVPLGSGQRVIRDV